MASRDSTDSPTSETNSHSSSDSGNSSAHSSQRPQPDSEAEFVQATVAFEDPLPEHESVLEPWLYYYGRDIAPALSQAISGQARVGTIAMLDDTPIGVISCLSYQKHAEILPSTPFVKAGTGWIVFGTPFINFPSNLLPWLLQALFDEMHWAQEEDAMKQSSERVWRFERFVHVGIGHEPVNSTRQKRPRRTASHGRVTKRRHALLTKGIPLNGRSVDEDEKLRQAPQMYRKEQDVARTLTFPSLLDDVFFSYATATWDLKRCTRLNECNVDGSRIAMLVESKSIPMIRSTIRRRLGDDKIPHAETGQILLNDVHDGNES